jgi:hypothetical protein
MVGDCCGQRWTAWFLWEKGITLSDIYNSLSAQCGEKALSCSTVLAGYRIFDRGNKIKQVAVRDWYCSILKNGSVKPSRNSQGDGSDL